MLSTVTLEGNVTESAGAGSLFAVHQLELVALIPSITKLAL